MVDKKQNMQDSAIGRVPPQATDVEKAVLGALMLEMDAIHRISDVIDTSSFYDGRHQIIFDAIKKISSDKKPIDLISVTQELKNRNKLDGVGGPLYVTQLTSRVASAAHIEFHARIIAQKFIQRELIRISSEIQHDSYDDAMDMDDLLSDARGKLNDVDNLVSCANSGQTSQVVAAEALQELERDCKATQLGISPGLPTGLSDLDRALGGWRKTNLIILAARPGIGKSSLALHFAVVAAMNGHWVNFYGLEMKNHDYFRIILSGMTGIPRTDIRDGRLTEEDWKKVHEATAKLERLPIIWNDHAGITVNQIRSNTIRNKRAGRCELVIIDYLQLVKPTDKKAIREQQVSEISRTLKETALGEDLPIIALSQLNRDVEKRADKEPNTADLRESGALEQDADVILFLWEDDKLRLKVGKNRRGKKGPIDFWANEEKVLFGDSEPYDQAFADMPPAYDFNEIPSEDTPF
ncbi:replicative DNA helicase [Gaoshiqia sediminis]|uniref:DNA 5'-3' helicase n=1 Tax=Gaoshiqia sediminis TaxID=2986998 RepID=A0AA41YAK0_9BACT|nr:replicative DNA helicase [Gaoshiqia sediminis]MCW0484048.1 replicative DNA helicase [Gaoshiqia sediminis]